MRIENDLNFNSKNTLKNHKTHMSLLNRVIILLVVCIAVSGFTGCGLLMGGGLGNYDAFEGLGSQYDDIQLQDGTNNGSLGSVIGEAPEDGNTGDLSLDISDTATSNATSFTEVVARTEKSVVEINTETVTYSQWSGQYIVTGAGSGVIISKSPQNGNIYHIVTNDHVIEGAETITVILHDGKKYAATLIGTDVITDVALLAIEVEEGTELSTAVLANSENVLLDGQDIYAIGNPLGELGGSVSKGIISKTARKILIKGIKMELMQIDAAVNPGNSGGGLFDISGNLIGIVNAKYSEEGIEGLGFAIPINTVQKVVVELFEHGYVTGRPGLGFELEEVTYSTGSYFSSTSVVYPTVVSNDKTITGTYMDDSGKVQNFVFADNDIICEINGTEVNSLAAFQSCLLDYKIGENVTLSVLRKTSNSRNYNEYAVKVVLSEYIPAE